MASPGSSRRSEPSADRHADAASRTAASAPPTASGSRSHRPSGASSSTRATPSADSASRSASAWSTCRPQRRAAAVTAAAVSSAVATPVTRSTRSCASSTITTSCSGSTPRGSSASIASSAWLVTTTSARPASARARSAKHVHADRAPGHPEALPGGHRQLAPGPVRHAGHQLVAVAGLAVRGPVVQPLDVPPERGHRGGVEERLIGVVLRSAVQPVQAQVVPPTLEDREPRLPAEQRREGRRQPRQVPVDQLALQRDRRGGDDHRGVPLDGVPDRRHQVGQRLPGAGAGLHGQVLAARDRGRDRGRHPLLALAGLPVHRGHGGVQQLGQCGQPDSGALVRAHPPDATASPPAARARRRSPVRLAPIAVATSVADATVAARRPGWAG